MNGWSYYMGEDGAAVAECRAERVSVWSDGEGLGIHWTPLNGSIWTPTIPIEVVRGILPGHVSYDGHELRNAVQPLMLAETQDDILDAAIELRRRVAFMKSRMS